MSSQDNNPPDQGAIAWICTTFSAMKIGLPSFLGGGSSEAQDEVEWQKNRALAMLSILETVKVSQDLPDTERQPLLDDIAKVRTAATAEPLKKEDLDSVVQIAAGLPLRASDANDALQKRKTDIAAHKQDALDLPDPEHALTTEIEALKLLRQAAVFDPVGKLTDDMVKAAATALAAVQKKAEEITVDATAREKKRAEFDARLVKIVPPIAATGKQVLALLKAVGAERRTLSDAKTMKEIEATDINIKKHEKTVSDITALTDARAKAEKALSVARALVKSNSKSMEAECFEHASKMLGDATTKIDTAKKIADYEDAEKDIAKIGPWLTKAAQYYAFMVKWRYETTFYIQSIVPDSNSGTDKNIAKAKIEAMEKWQDTLLTAAAALAKAGKPDDAKSKLGEFYSGKTQYADPQSGNMTDVNVDGAKNTKALQLAAVINDFATTALPTLTQIGKLGLPQPSNNYRKQYDAAKKRGCDKAEYDPAIVDLGALKTKMTEYQKVIDKYLEYVGASAVPAVATAIGEMRTELNGEQFNAALGKLTALDGTASNKEAAEYASKRASLKKSVNWLLKTLDGPVKAALETPWDAAETETQHSAKMSKLGTVETLLPDCRKLVDAQRDAESLKGKLDASDTYKMLDAAETLRNGGDIAGAAKAYQEAIVGFGRLAGYLATVANLTRTRDSLSDSHSVLKTAIGKALTEANTDALGRKWDDADNKLSAVLNDPESKAQITLIERFDLRCKKLERAKDGVLKLMKENAAKKKIEEPWTKAIGFAQKHQYIEAAEELDALEPMLAEARTYVASATRARRALTAMDKIAVTAVATAKAKAKADTESAHSGASDLSTRVSTAQASAESAVLTAIYPPPNDKTKLSADLVEAEKEAQKGDYVEGKKKFDAICLAAQDGMKAAASAAEKLENGHYVEAHGPGTTAEQQKTRILTGMRPDGKKVPTNTASQFTEIGDLLATREMALEAAAAKDARVNGTTVKEGEGLEVIVETDCPMPVGESFMSDAPKMEYRGGEFKEGKTFENYEHVPGLTRVFTKLIFVFDNPHDSKRLLTFDKAKAAYTSAGKTFPPDETPAKDWPGTWVVHQHYPTPNGFDPVTGEYSE